MIVKTPAKINLFLKVCGQRPDGYHNIETLFFPLENPGDNITISDSVNERPEITTNNPLIPVDENNLCFQTAVIFAKFANIKPSWKIDIEKKIPVSAGLGGGSSDAAAVLKALAELHPAVTEDTLKKIALSLGADVPFFLNPVPSIARGVGEELAPIPDMPNIPLVIVNPKFPVSAAWGYKNYQTSDKKANIEDVISAIRAKDWGMLNGCFQNDLQKSVFEKFPIMSMLQRNLIEAGADFVGMSGSGPTLFAICLDSEATSQVAATVSGEFTDSVLSFATRTVCGSSRKCVPIKILP